MFGGRRRREEAAAEAAREAERRALFARLAERPPNVCPFLGLVDERTGYIPGISDDHRCFAFGDPAPLSAEQQTRVCQERGYGHCPRYLRGVLVIPTEELQALRNPAAVEPDPEPPPEAAGAPTPERARRGTLVAAALVVLLLVGAGVGYLALLAGEGVPVAVAPTTTPQASPAATPAATAAGSPAVTSTPPVAATPSGSPTPVPEATPVAGDTFAFYEVSVAPETYTVYELDGAGDVVDVRTANFTDFSFARVEPVEGGDGEVYWVTQEGGLTGLGYRYPDSGDFGIRAVFLTDAGVRRSEFLDTDELTRMPEATPAP